MILCFTGTGNSRRVADQLQEALGDEVMRFAPGLMRNPEKINLRITDNRIVWVLPVHCWGMPKTVAEVMKKANIHTTGEVSHHLVCTCGDDIGYADMQWRKLLKKRGWKGKSAFSVQMPNTYTFMRGFDVDLPDVAEAKLQRMPSRLPAIVEAIESDSTIVDVVRGKWPRLKTWVAYRWFMWAMMSTKPFGYTSDCSGCGRCARNCSHINISMLEGHPVWGDKCTMCLRCYHCCPRHAVKYGKATDGKGQYVCPGYSLKS